MYRGMKAKQTASPGESAQKWCMLRHVVEGPQQERMTIETLPTTSSEYKDGWTLNNLSASAPCPPAVTGRQNQRHAPSATGLKACRSRRGLSKGKKV